MILIFQQWFMGILVFQKSCQKFCGFFWRVFFEQFDLFFFEIENMMKCYVCVIVVLWFFFLQVGVDKKENRFFLFVIRMERGDKSGIKFQGMFFFLKVKIFWCDFNVEYVRYFLYVN